MPKIFWIKSRLEEQQQRLQEAQDVTEIKNDVLQDKPLSLTIKKDDKKSTDEHLFDKHDGPSKSDTNLPRRFKSSLGGDVPYGSRGHVLTRAERKEYAPLLPPDKIKLPEKEKPSKDAVPEPKAPVRCFSVIQRTPKTTKREEDNDPKLPLMQIIQEPEQEEPLDYKIHKRQGEVEDENEERRNREQRRSNCHKIAKPLVSSQARIVKMPLIMSAAAGHGRGSNGNQGNNNQGSSSGQSSGGSINFSGGTASGGSGGALGGGTAGGGGGGMNPGRDGRQNYGPSSPPTGSLPPFYESLKGGNGNNNYNANSNFSYNNVINGHQNMDTGQEIHINLSGSQSPPKQYSTLQNASYGLVMKDEVDLDIYESKLEAMGNLLPSAYNGYDDAMMVEMVSGAVDPLQFTTALTFSSTAEQTLLEQLSDAADLSTFLQRLPNEENDEEIINSPAMTPDSTQINNVENMDHFNDHVLNRNYQNQNERLNPQFTKFYQDGLTSYSQSVNNENLVPMQAQQMLSPSLSSFNGNGLDLDSPTTMSLPSPGAASCSLDGGSPNGTENGSISPPSNVSVRRDSSSNDSPARVNVLQQRVSRKLIQALLV